MRLLLVLLLVSTACTGGGGIVDAADPVTVVATEVGEGGAAGGLMTDATLEAGDCPEPVADIAVCGFLVVPERRGDPTSQVIEVAWARLGPEVSDDPPLRRSPALLVVPDGPGDSGLAEVEQWRDSPLRSDREIVMIDPRGTGRSFPLLDCGQPPRAALPPDLVEDCRRTLVADGVDLMAYDTAAIAADLEDLRLALGLGQVDLLGIGHGARVALEMVRDGSAGVRAMVLDSPVPPEVDVYAGRAADAQAALNRLLDLCAQQRPCARRYAGLGPSLEDTVRELNRIATEVEGGPVTGDELVVAAVAAMRGLTGPAGVPASLQRAVDGDPDGALEALQTLAVTGAAVPRSGFSEGLRLASECRDEVPFADTPDVDGLTAVGSAIASDVDAFIAACATWPTGAADDTANDPVDAAVFALFLSGEFDPFSPPAWGAAAAARIDDSVVVQVDGAGHRVHDASDCTIGIVQRFLARPGASLDGVCAMGTTTIFDLG